MSNKKSVKKNYIYNVLYQLLLIILPIITTPYLARKLGAGGNGIYGYTISIVTYFILFGSLGISLYGQREIAYNQKNKENRSAILFELLVIKTITMITSAIVFYCIFCIHGEYSIYFRILLIEMLANLLDISWYYQGMEEFRKIAVRNFIVRIISLICIFVFIKSPSDINKYLYIYVLCTLFGSATLWLGLKKYIVKPKELNIKRHIAMIFSLFVPQIAMTVYTVLDKTMIGAILNDMSEVGYYEQSQKIIKILLTVITAVGTVMLPRLAKCFSEKDFDQIKSYMRKTFRYVFMISIPLMLGIIAVSNNFAPLFFGKGYDKVPIIMQTLSFIIVFISISNVIGIQYLLSVKRQKEFSISVIAGAVINFIFNFILIGQYKALGAAISTVIAELSVTLIQIYFIRKDFRIKDIFGTSFNYFIASIIMFIVCMAIDVLIETKMVALIVQISVGILIYFALLRIMKDKLFIELIGHLKRLLLRRNI